MRALERKLTALEDGADTICVSSGMAAINAVTLKESLVEAAQEVGVALTDRVIELEPFGEGATEWKPDSSLPFSKWQVDMPLPASEADKVMERIQEKMNADPVWISSSSVGARVAGDMIGRAFGALFASLLCIIGYIWFRFQRVLYGFAAVAALVHDVLITLGAIAISVFLADAFGFLLIEEFKISLPVVAAFLTIIGYSLNDTIVVFDRIREVKVQYQRMRGMMTTMLGGMIGLPGPDWRPEPADARAWRFALLLLFAAAVFRGLLSWLVPLVPDSRATDAPAAVAPDPREQMRQIRSTRLWFTRHPSRWSNAVMRR